MSAVAVVMLLLAMLHCFAAYRLVQRDEALRALRQVCLSIAAGLASVAVLGLAVFA